MIVALTAATSADSYSSALAPGTVKSLRDSMNSSLVDASKELQSEPPPLIAVKIAAAASTRALCALAASAYVLTTLANSS